MCWSHRCLCKVSERPPSLHCVCLGAGLRALISGPEIWQSQQVMTEAVVRSHPEPQRRLTFQDDERGPFSTQKHRSVEFDNVIVSFSLSVTFIFTWGVLDIYQLLNILMSCQLKVQLIDPIYIVFSLLNQIRLIFFLTHGGGTEHEDVWRAATCNSRVKAAWKNPFSV